MLIKLTVDQDAIEQAISDYVSGQITVNEDHRITVTVKMKKGEASADVQIAPEGYVEPAKAKRGPKGTGAAKPAATNADGTVKRRGRPPKAKPVEEVTPTPTETAPTDAPTPASDTTVTNTDTGVSATVDASETSTQAAEVAVAGETPVEPTTGTVETTDTSIVEPTVQPTEATSEPVADVTADETPVDQPATEEAIAPDVLPEATTEAEAGTVTTDEAPKSLFGNLKQPTNS